MCKLATLISTPHCIANRILDSENCSIEPVECRPTMPNGDKLDCDAPSESPVAKQTDTTKDTDASTETGQTISKMIDLCLSLVLDEEELDIIADGFKTMRYNERSLNQSLGYIVHCALFLDIEIKKSLQNRNPEVQLAIWAAGALLKKQLHKWDTSMPMPAIAVSGHTWTYYLFFECSGNLVCRSRSYI